MTIAFTGTGGLFTRVGRMGGLLNSMNSFRGAVDLSAASIVSVGVGVNNIEAQYASTRQDLIDRLYSSRDTYRQVHGSFAQYLQGLAQSTVIAMADDDVKLTQVTLQAALTELIRQMVANSQVVARPTITATVTAGSSNNGNGTLVASVLGGTGVQRDYVIPETVDVICTSDSQVGATLSREPFSARGDAAQSDVLSWDWPKGSGASTQLTAIDAGSTSSQLLANGDFENFTSNVPNSWTVDVGTGGVDLFAAGSSDAWSGSNALKYTGTGGAPLTGIYQAVTLRPNTVYAVACAMKRSASLAAGVLSIDLHNGSAIINDDAAVANALTQTLSALTTSYVWKTAFFRTPRVMPTTVRLRVKATTALTSGESVFVDRLALAPATELYSGGPYVALFSGPTKFVVNDSFAIAVANNYATNAKWQFLADRFFGLRSLGLQIPSTTGAATILDSLIA